VRLFKSLFVVSWISIAVAAEPANPPQAAIASAHPLATRAGFAILQQGGNAFDAAVAVSAALAVVEPSGSGLGGGGFWLLHRASDSRQVMLDGRERAPFAARRDMYLDAAGHADPKASINGPLAAGIPGMPAAIVHLAERYGRLALKQSLAPAIGYARYGFPVDEGYLQLIGFRLPIIQKYKSSADIFLRDGELPQLRFKLVQKDLADTLEHIAESGRDGFYLGIVAKRLVEGSQAAGGIWTYKDLAEYRVVERKPINGVYKGIRVSSASPPSSGGVVLVEALNVLSGFDLAKVGAIDRTHLVVEAMRRAYRDRSIYLGDPDFVQMPLKRLLSKKYAATLREGIRLDRKGLHSSGHINRREQTTQEGRNTTHFSVLDRDGNRVAATLSINFPFGSGFVPPGTGVLLNDEMDDFVSHPDAANVYGLTGGDANSIQPGKRMLSSMTPTFLEDDTRVAILGTPGGSRIISMVLLATLDFADGNDANSWVRVPRIHHQYAPDVIQYEQGGLTDDEIMGLSKKGHDLKDVGRRYGNMQAILWDKRNNTVIAASDPRKAGLALSR